MTITRYGRTLRACMAATLVSCGQSPIAPNLVPPARSGAESLTRHDGHCPRKRCIIVTSQNGYTNKSLSAVLFFARSAGGDVPPVSEISGSNTMLAYPSGLAIDSSNSIYVANVNNSITVYAAGAEGNVAPIRTIKGTNTRLNHPAGLAIDSHDELYVANNQGKDDPITVYAPDANGDAAPIRTIRGKKTQLYAPWGLAFDSRSNLYVANDDPNNGWITVYAANANGDVAPKRTIKGSATQLDGPAGLAVDASGYLYVVDSTDEGLVIFAPGANGDEAPVSSFTSGYLYSAFGIALDRQDNMYVTNVGYDDPPFVAVFAAGTIGNQGDLLRTILGKKTKLVVPEGIVVR